MPQRSMHTAVSAIMAVAMAIVLAALGSAISPKSGEPFLERCTIRGIEGSRLMYEHDGKAVAASFDDGATIAFPDGSEASLSSMARHSALLSGKPAIVEGVKKTSWPFRKHVSIHRVVLISY